MSSETRFKFGANWARFVETSLSEDKIAQSMAHLKDFLRLEDLRGRSFIDIGSGSGLSSLAAYRLGADRVFSFDYDANSVATTNKVRELAGDPSHWTVEQGSVLDQDYMSKLGKFDIVYSWGVLHHTGDMWAAVRNAAIPLKRGGVYYIALYASEIYACLPSRDWLAEKRRYNAASEVQKRKMELAYGWRTGIRPALAAGRNPIRAIREYGGRGMSFWADARDWLGGYPMDFAAFKDTVAFCKRLDLDLVNCTTGEGNTEYLFAALAVNEQWRDIEAKRERKALSGPYASGGLYLFVAPLTRLRDAANSPDAPRKSRLMLYEDGKPLGQAHTPRGYIRAHGLGRFSHWEDSLYFSASDSTNPNLNGRAYSYVEQY